MTTEEQKQAVQTLLEQRKPAIAFIETLRQGPVDVAFDNIVSVNAWFVHEMTDDSEAEVEKCIQQFVDNIRRAMTEVREGFAKQAAQRTAQRAANPEH